jgi:hypothetical protein
MRSPSPRLRSLLVDAAAVLALLAATVVLYHGAAGLWWTHDDFFQLRYVHAWGPADYAFDPWVARQLPNGMATPLLFASLDADLSLFGPEPLGFYLHQLASLGLAAAALYGLLRLWLSPGGSLLGGFLFLAGPPVASLAPLLMVRHYVEAVLLGALAAAAWVLAVRARREGVGRALSALSAVLWLLAAAAKEIAVPLVLFLPFVPEGDRRTRLSRLVPHAVALAAYAVYRLHLLGGLGEGYGWAVEPGDWPRLALTLPVKVGREMLGAPIWLGFVLLAALLAGALALGRRAWLPGLGLLLALLPVLPVSTEMAPRYAMPAWLVLVVAFVFGVRGLEARTARGLALVAVLAALSVNQAVWASQLSRLERMSAEHRAVLELGEGDRLRRPAGPPASMRESLAFRREVLGEPDEGGGWFYDDLFLCLRGGEVRRLWEYDVEDRRVEEVTAELPALRRACAGQRRDAPLSAAFRSEGGSLFWELGPYQEGSWRFVFGDGAEAFEVPGAGGFRFGDLREVELRVRYDSPDGWTTYSPQLTMDFGRSRRYGWRRGAGRLEAGR